MGSNREREKRLAALEAAEEERIAADVRRLLLIVRGVQERFTLAELATHAGAVRRHAAGPPDTPDDLSADERAILARFEAYSDALGEPALYQRLVTRLGSAEELDRRLLALEREMVALRRRGEVHSFEDRRLAGDTLAGSVLMYKLAPHELQAIVNSQAPDGCGAYGMLLQLADRYPGLADARLLPPPA